MTWFNGIRFAMACLVSLLMLWHIYDADKGVFFSKPQLYLYGCLLPAYFLGLILISILLFNVEHAINLTLSMCFDTFLIISIYYALMSFLIGPLRKAFSAKACGLLWLVPNYLYFLQRTNSGMESDRPAMILPLPGNIADYILLIWLAGFLIYLSFQFFLHLQFRRMLLHGSYPVTDDKICTLWDSEKEKLSLADKPYQLMISPNTSTPLSIGLLEKSTVVFIPEKNYTLEEWTLILRHELTHIYRGDCFTKLFLTICTAMCWFNPLMWRAMKKCAEDLELSCDERILENASETQRRQYANLILTTAGDQRGFTTCLCTTASSLAYRLKNILHPQAKRWGGFLAAAVFLILAMSCGHIALAYTEETGEEAIYQSKDPSAFRIDLISLSNENQHSTLSCKDPEGLADYLSGLRVKRLTGEYSFSQAEQELFVWYVCEGEYYRVFIRDQILIVVPPEKSRVGDPYYYEKAYLIDHPVDWAHMRSLMEYGPSLILHIPTKAGIQSTSATLYRLDRVENGHTIPIRRGSQTTDIFHILDDTTQDISLQFSHPVIDYSITIENWTRTETTVLTADLLTNPEVIPLLYDHGHYTVHATLAAEGDDRYIAEFRFDSRNMGLEEHTG